MMYRKGAIGAMMDEYERAVGELMAVFGAVQQNLYETIQDPNTADENCRSIKTIMSHVVSSGYSYADYFRRVFQVTSSRPPRGQQLAFSEVPGAMKKMMIYTEETLHGHWEMPEEEMMAMKMQASWGPLYDAEQMLEHAIVHILRHRRQIQRWLGA